MTTSPSEQLAIVWERVVAGAYADELPTESAGPAAEAEPVVWTEFVLDSPFVASRYGDERLFFQHQFE